MKNTFRLAGETVVLEQLVQYHSYWLLFKHIFVKNYPRGIL
ncbi:unknown [[Mannheimia] succiniciproducens MBEL55E]|uniref:Uncharacterized protein n=1 Tax=Mannheimia succiniciproducens (strain KCTC 0769BP / MBEL55E) TaxID=221988 RepID=Q65Q97_MANSM|nr:unknown [[Mannheimia] succiniciproducens MBEL55E]